MMEVDPNAIRPDQMGRMIRAQLEAQINSYGRDPRQLTGDDLADFMLWNCFALEDELHEAMNEFKWKPWLTDGSRGVILDRGAFIGELVDLWHFMMNLMLAGSHGWEPEEIAAHFAAAYDAKLAVNKARQKNGYDGVKDADGRATDEPHRDTPQHMRETIDEHLRRQRENIIKQADTGSGSHDYA